MLSLGRLPSQEAVLSKFVGKDQSLIDYFRTRQTPKVFAAFLDRDATIEILKSRFEQTNAIVIRKANDITAGRFDLLGLKQLDFGTPPDWHLEPRSGKKTPLVHWSRLDYLDAEVAGDKKIVWELNRHQYFMTLGRAYWLTGDELYAKTFVEHLESWMGHNPPKLGINWASSLEVSFRSISWLWAFEFFKDSPSLTSEVLLRALQYLHVHGRHLETYLSTYFSPNTHLTGEALGLYYLGTMLPEFAEASRWRALGARILIEQLPIHVRPDGVYFEQSSYYHRYTTDFYLHFLLLSRANNEELALATNQFTTPQGGGLLLDHLMYITRPDGLTPLFGDDDGGRLVMLSESRPNDFRATLSTGAALFNRPDYKFVARELSEETLWLLGPKGCDSFDSLQASEPQQQSVAFKDGGYYVMRDGWSNTSNYLLFDCGPHGQANCGHAHADALSFELSTGGEAMLIDPGTYTYTGSAQERDWFRGSSAHNTLMIDGHSSSEGAGPFSWNSIARCETTEWITRPRFDYVSGMHDGYSRLNTAVSHVRSILFLKGDYCVVQDDIDTEYLAEVTINVHLPPSAKGSLNSSGNLDIQGQSTSLKVVSKGVAGVWKQEDGWVSDCYAKKERAQVFVYSARVSHGESSIITMFLPAAAGILEITELEATGGIAIQLKGKSHTDVLLIRTTGRVETSTLASDSSLTWLRLGKEESNVPQELVAIGGTTITFKGRDILRFGPGAKYVEMRWDGRQS